MILINIYASFANLPLIIEFWTLFHQSDQVSYEVFKNWMKENVSCLNMSMWLLRESSILNTSSDQQTPTFYQTLAGITHRELKCWFDKLSDLEIVVYWCERWINYQYIKLCVLLLTESCSYLMVISWVFNDLLCKLLNKTFPSKTFLKGE